MPNGLAMNCHMHGNDLWFFDTIRGHMIPGDVIEDTEDRFLFQSRGFERGIWTFTLLTIEDFRGEIWQIVENGKLLADSLQSTNELQQWYIDHYGDEAGFDKTGTPDSPT